MQQPLVSFIIPVYNVELYLTDAIESVINQTIHKELIIVDDGSTDRSLEIALNYANQYPFITVVRQSNKKVSQACNAAVRLATGKYIFFLDSDDYLLGNYFETMCAYAEQYNIDILKVQAETQEHFPHHLGERRKIQTAFPHLTPTNMILSTGFECLVSMVEQLWIPCSRWVMIRRQFLLENHINFIPNIKAEDQIYTIQLLTCREDVRVLEADFLVYHYRKRENSSVTTKRDIQFFIDHFRMANLILDWKNTHHFPDKVNYSLYHIIWRLNETAYKYLLDFPIDIQMQYRSYFDPQVLRQFDELYQTYPPSY